MEDKPLLHPRKFDDLVLEYLFGDGHRVSFPNRNPHMNRLTHMMMSMRKSTIAKPFKTRQFCFKVYALCNQFLVFYFQSFKFLKGIVNCCF